jgi:polygalacturonase
MTLNFAVNNQSLSLDRSQQNLKLVADSKNYLITKFSFETSEWKKGDLVYALFSHKGKTYKKILGSDEELSVNECYVPEEVTKTPGFTVSLVYGDRIPTNTVGIKLGASGYTENIENQIATPSVME